MRSSRRRWSSHSDALDRRWERDAYQDLGFEDALARFAALWAEARELGQDGARDWRADLETDLSIARAVNGLPPT